MKSLGRLKQQVKFLAHVCCGLNLGSLSLISRPRRAAQYALDNLFLLNLAADRGLHRKNLRELNRKFPPSINLALSDVVGSLDSWSPFSLVDVLALSVVARLWEPRSVFEIGTQNGHTALAFALNTPEDCRIWTLDLPPDASAQPALPTTIRDRVHIKSWVSGSAPPPVFRNSPVAHKVSQLYGDSATFDFTRFHGKADLFFVDGAHSYEYVRSDTERALQCCHSGSIIVWHDYGRYGVGGVSKYLHELARAIPIYRLGASSVAMHIVP